MTSRVTPEVTVVIVNFNSGANAAACLASAAADLQHRRWDAVVVDNASRPGDLAPLEVTGFAGGARLVRNTRNAGFGAAVNAAVRLTDAPLVWLLNPDCLIRPGAFAELERALQEDPARALAAPRLLNADGSLQASARGEPSAMTGLFGRNTLLTKYFPQARAARRNLPAGDLAVSAPDGADVDWVMGAVMLIRRDAFDGVGGFDEGYFLYWEDADLCRRLRDRGFRVRYVPRAAVVHDGGVSAESDPSLAIRAFHRGAYRYYATHVAPGKLNPTRLAARVALGLRAEWRLWRRR